MYLRALAVVALLSLPLACGPEAPAEEAGAEDLTSARADRARGFTTDFRRFLASSSWAELDFARADLDGDSAYGGRARAGTTLRHDPVVFVHGNSDRGLGGRFDGFATSLAAFRAAGYTSAELYTFTWGPGDPAQAGLQYHSRANLTRVRAFLEAVLAYTGAEHVDVVGHSMGVTLARKAIAGGAASDLLAGGDYDLGAPLTDRIDAFVGISGANFGLASCVPVASVAPTCGMTNGLYPGLPLANGDVSGRSLFLADLLAKPHAEGRFVAAMWSPGDGILGAELYGSPTAKIPEDDAEVVLDASCDHFASKALSTTAQIALVRDHDARVAPAPCK